MREAGEALTDALSRAEKGAKDVADAARAKERKQAEAERREENPPSGLISTLANVQQRIARVRQSPQVMLPAQRLREFIEQDLRIAWGE